MAPSILFLILGTSVVILVISLETIQKKGGKKLNVAPRWHQRWQHSGVSTPRSEQKGNPQVTEQALQHPAENGYRNQSKIQAKFQSIRVGSLLSTISAPKSTKRRGRQNGEAVFGDDCAPNAPKATPKPPKWTPKATPRPPNGGPKGNPKRPKCFPHGTPQTSETTPKVTNPTSKSGNASSVSKFEKT